MTRNHLVEDIHNVLEMVHEAERDGEQVERARRAIQGLHRHILSESGVPGQVEGCLRESAQTVGESGTRLDAQGWAHIRACLETALDFARA